MAGGLVYANTPGGRMSCSALCHAPILDSYPTVRKPSDGILVALRARLRATAAVTGAQRVRVLTLRGTIGGHEQTAFVRLEYWAPPVLG